MQAPGRTAEIVLFHHALGLTPGVVTFAERLRTAGHVVYTPDLHDERTFTELVDGVAYARNTGFNTIIERGVNTADRLPTDLVYAGISLGVMPAQMLAQIRAGARGACCSPPACRRPSSTATGRRASRRLWVFRVLVGSGKRLFADGTVPSGLKLVDKSRRPAS